MCLIEIFSIKEDIILIIRDNISYNNYNQYLGYYAMIYFL